MNSPILKLTAPWLHDGRAFLKEKVLVTGAEGKIIDIIGREEAGEQVRVLEGILCPGFVNTHCHLELSHLKGVIAEHTGLIDFLIAVMQRRGDTAAEHIQEAAAAAEEAMYQEGIVAVGDIANTADSLTVKKSERLYYHTFVEALGFSAAGAAKSMQRAAQIRKAFEEQGLAVSTVPHAPYSVSKSLFRLIDDCRDATICIHNQESPAEDLLYEGEASDFYRLYETLGIDYSSFTPTGSSSLQSWMPEFTHGQTLLAVHNTFSRAGDIRLALASPHRIYWCLCPGANAYIEERMPPADFLFHQGASIVLGTDSLASNHQLSLLEELKTLQFHFPDLPLEAMLSWATINGAEALGCGARFGSFTRGKAPAVIQLSPVGQVGNTPVLSAETSVRRLNLSSVF